jgi:antitoxin component YwqK of YwqJK toxin-antitoxin module
MKYNIAIIATFFKLFSSYGQTNDWSKMNLKGSPVQVVEQTLNDKGKEYGRIEYNFNPKGFLISEIKTAFVFGQKAILKSVYSYNDNQSLQSVANYEQGKLKGKTVYTYSNNSSIITEYDAQGKIIEPNQGILEAQEEPSEIITEKNEHGDVVTSYTIEKNAEASIPNLPHKNVTVLEKNEYKYDSKNNCISLVSKVLSAGETEPFVAKRAKRTIVYY